MTALIATYLVGSTDGYRIFEARQYGSEFGILIGSLSICNCCLFSWVLVGQFCCPLFAYSNISFKRSFLVSIDVLQMTALPKVYSVSIAAMNM